MIPELESGKLTVDLPEYGLRAGDRGVVVLIHAGRTIEAYEVEFFTPEGETIDVVTVSADQIEPAARQVTREPAFASGRLTSDLLHDRLRSGEVGKLLAAYGDGESYLVHFYRPDRDRGIVTYVDSSQLELLDSMPYWAKQPTPAAAKG